MSQLTKAQVDWAHTVGSFDYDDTRGVLCDNSGNIYMTGRYKLTVDFDPGPAVASSTASGINSSYVVKYDNAGNLLWVVTYDLIINTMELDNGGDILIGGSYTGIIDFDPGTGVMSDTASGPGDAFLLKLSSSGDLTWLKIFDGSAGGSESVAALNVDNGGNILITGRFDEEIDLDPGVSIALDSTVGLTDIFILKLDPSGNFVWGKTIGSAGNDNPGDISHDNQNNIYVLGDYTDTIDVDPGIDTVLLGDVDKFFLLKLDNSGDFVWVNNMFGDIHSYPSQLVNDINGSMYLCYFYMAAHDCDPGSNTINIPLVGFGGCAIVKCNTGGDVIWGVPISGSTSESVRGLTFDTHHQLLISGYTLSDTLDLDPGPGAHYLYPQNFSEGFVLNLDTNGQFIEAGSFSGTGSLLAGYTASDPTGNVIVTGYYTDSVDVDPNSGQSVLYSNGYVDAWIVKFGGLLGVTGFSQQVRLYPNPASSFLQIESEFQVVDVKIYNLSGGLVDNSILLGDQIFLGSHCANGVFIIEILLENGSFERRRIIINR